MFDYLYIPDNGRPFSGGIKPQAEKPNNLENTSDRKKYTEFDEN